MIRVTVLSPNPALRIGLREMLSTDPEVSVTGEGGSLDEVDLEGSQILIITSISAVPFINAIDGFPAVLLLTENADDAKVLVHSRISTWGFLSTEATLEEIIQAVRALAEGLIVGTPGLMRGVLHPAEKYELTGDGSLPDPLTTREIEVLEQIAQGLANKQIAVALGISEHTVKFHLSSLYTKLNVSSRTEAVKVGFGLGLISL